MSLTHRPVRASRLAPTGRPCPAGGTDGLTLIEVLLALALLSLAGVIVYSSLNTALTSWGAGLVQGRRDQVARITLARLSQQLKSTVPAVVKGRRSGPAFEGERDRLRFVTLLPVGTDRSLAQVSYSVEDHEGGRHLVYREFPWPDKNFFEGGEPVKEEWIPEVSGLEFVLKTREKGDEGDEDEDGDEWKAGENGDFPTEVEISLSVAGAEDGEGYSTVVPLRARRWQ